MHTLRIRVSLTLRESLCQNQVFVDKRRGMHFLSCIPSFGKSLLSKHEGRCEPPPYTRSKKLNLLVGREGRSVVVGHEASKQITDQIECVGKRGAQNW